MFHTAVGAGEGGQGVPIDGQVDTVADLGLAVTQSS